MRERIKSIVMSIITTDEKVGETSGASGHLADKSLKIDKLDIKEVEKGYIVNVEYSVYISTEFTYEPDNPPYHYTKHKEINLTKDLSVH